MWPVFPWWEESPGPPGEGEPLGTTFTGRDRDHARVSRDVTRWCAWQSQRSRRTVALLSSVAPIKPWGLPLGFRTLPPCPRILSLRRQLPELLAPVLLPLLNSPLPSPPCCPRRCNGPRVQIQHLPLVLRGPRPSRPPSLVDHRRGVAAAR